MEGSDTAQLTTLVSCYDAIVWSAGAGGGSPERTYAVTDLDTLSTVESSGRELMDRGISITLADRPGSALLRYQRNPGDAG